MKAVAHGFKMASLSEQSRVRELFDNMTLGVVRSLGKFETNIFKCIVIRTIMVILALTAKQKPQPSNECQHQEIWKHKITSDKEFSQHF